MPLFCLFFPFASCVKDKKWNWSASISMKGLLIDFWSIFDPRLHLEVCVIFSCWTLENLLKMENEYCKCCCCFFWERLVINLLITNSKFIQIFLFSLESVFLKIYLPVNLSVEISKKDTNSIRLRNDKNLGSGIKRPIFTKRGRKGKEFRNHKQCFIYNRGMEQAEKIRRESKDKA